MTHVAHELTEEFPENVEAIQTMRVANAHFARLADRYHEVNRSLHRMETNVEPADDFIMEELKKKRLLLKDEIAALLNA